LKKQNINRKNTKKKVPNLDGPRSSKPTWSLGCAVPRRRSFRDSHTQRLAACQTKHRLSDSRWADPLGSCRKEVVTYFSMDVHDPSYSPLVPTFVGGDPNSNPTMHDHFLNFLNMSENSNFPNMSENFESEQKYYFEQITKM
jgi:hypothetical protein